METILNNKRFIKVSVFFMTVLSILVIAKLINEIKESSYIGRGNQPANVISVSGTGEVMAVSDIATLSINLSKDGATAKEAQGTLNESITKALDYLRTKNIADKDIKSEYGGLSPKYSYDTIACYTYPCPRKDPKIIGYTATQSISVKIRDVDSANDVRTGLADLGMNDISGPTFSIDDEDTFKDQARQMAIDDAREKAEVLARALHVRLGRITNFSEGGSPVYPMMYAEKDMMMVGAQASNPAPELPKGENKIMSNVIITYEIR